MSIKKRSLKFVKTYIAPLFFTDRFFGSLAILSVLFVLSFFFESLALIPFVALLVLVITCIIDYWLLFGKINPLIANRSVAERLSNGDENDISISVYNTYAVPVYLEIIDEIPFQFQKRNVSFKIFLKPGEHKFIKYQLRPVKRGVYNFGNINIIASTGFGLLRKKFVLGIPLDVPVYPSYLQMRKYQILAISNRLSEIGVKKIRKFGHSMEFEQIKEYVLGDDYRTLNWNATARRGVLMVNNYSDEKSQQIYCVIDKGRVMKMPFEGLSLLDYAINTSLVLSNIALLKQDKAGIISFSDKIGSVLKADRKTLQMQWIQEILYNQKTRYLESDFEKLYSLVKTKITQRSLLILFTNFESVSGMRRQLPYLRQLASLHLLVVVFFENTEITSLLREPAENIQQVYTKVVAEKFVHEKKQIVKELQQNGILSILSAPHNLTASTLNKYLEIKARGVL